MKPGDEEALLAGLRALQEQVAGQEAPPAVEAALLREFRKAPRSKRKPFLWLGLAAAAGLFGVVLYKSAPAPVAVQTDVPKNAVVVAATVVPEPPIEVKPARPKPRRPRVRHAPVAAPEVATEFLPMPYAPRFTAEDRGQVVRVRLPRESMRTFGLPVNQDRIFSSVKADVLIGEDGIARAIRFVQ